MKKSLFALLILGILGGCYDEFRLDHVFSSVAFSRADGGSNLEGVLHRTVVKDEGLNLDVGINLTGILDNNKERWAEFVIDPDLIDTTMEALGYRLMPEAYYTLSNNSRFVIPSGSILGKVNIALDSAAFLADSSAASHIYGIPFRLVDTSEDSINSTLDTKIVVIKYINHFEGYYNQSGTITSHDAAGSVLDATDATLVLTMTTASLDTVITNGMLNQTGEAFQMKITVNPDRSATLENTPSSEANRIEQTGECHFDDTASTFTLNYKVTDETGAYKTAAVSLVWRNRVRDGVNEWRR